MPKKKWDFSRISPELSAYIDAFGEFRDEAAPAPEIEIKVKGSPKEFYQKYLNDDIKYILLYFTSNSIHIHSKPRYLLRLLDLEAVEYMDKVPGIYEPM